jgi:hypothetical protein
VLRRAYGHNSPENVAAHAAAEALAVVARVAAVARRRAAEVDVTQQAPRRAEVLEQKCGQLLAARAPLSLAGGGGLGAVVGGVVLAARAETFLNGRPDLDDTIRRLVAFAEVGWEHGQ